MNTIINPYIFKNTGLFTDLLSCWEMNESSGSVVIDSHSRQNGINYGATVNQLGKLNNAYNYDGTNDYLSISDSASVIQGPFSASVWMYYTDVINSTYDPGLIGKWLGVRSSGTAYPRSSWGLSIQNRYTLGFGFSTSGLYQSANYLASGNVSSLIINKWALVVGVYTGTALQIYINGNLITSKATTLQSIYQSDIDINIGVHYAIGYQQNLYSMKGLIDQTCIWNRALTQPEITTLYNGGNGLPYTSF